MFNFKQFNLRRSVFILFFLLICIFGRQVVSAQSKTVANAPPPGAVNYNPAEPWVFWYWMEASVSSAGIRADLIAMKQQGIAGAYLMCIKGKPDSLVIEPPVVQLTPIWWTKIREAFKIADSLGIRLAMHVGDGFATAGGPWITPAMSMQRVVWSDTTINGGKDLHIQLSRPDGIRENYYKDIAVYAFPELPGTDISTETIRPVVTTDAVGQDASMLIRPDNTENFSSKGPCRIDYAFEKPFTCRTVQVRTKGVTFQAKRLSLWISQDGKKYTFYQQLEPARSGWQDYTYPITYTIPVVKAKYFRFVFDPKGTEPGSEDLDDAKWSPSLKLTGLQLGSAPQIPQFEGKSGAIWRISKRADTTILPDDVCIPQSKLINITKSLQADGTLNWKAPVGRWTIVRMGHSSTGQKNETAGGGAGLECDKFNAAAVKMQFDNWFGLISRKMGPDLSAKVLKIFHVDSWECGSQNWSPVFRAAFKEKRGYDPIDYLPVMAGYPIGSAAASESFLYDIRLTIADLINEQFFGTLAGLAHQQGCLFSAECTAPIMVTDGLRHYDKVDIPMGEFWLRSPTHDKPNDILDAVSGAHIYGKKIVQAEAFTEIRNKWDEYPGMLKTLQDHHYALGINRFVLHVMTANPWLNKAPGMTLNGIGLYFQRDQTWWPLTHGWLDYTRRCQALLQEGVPVTDIAVFNGEEIPDRAILPDRLLSDLPGIFGPERIASEEKRLANLGNPMQHIPEGVTSSAGISTAADWIDPLHGYKYDALNADALLRLATVKDRRVILPGGASYALLVLPQLEKMDPSHNWMSIPVARKILSLVRAGATVLVNRYPTMQPGLHGGASANAILQKLMDSLMGGHYTAANHPAASAVRTFGKGRVLFGPYEKADFSSLGIEKDFQARQRDGKEANGIAWTHRQLNQQEPSDNPVWTSDLPTLEQVKDLYFVSNQLESPQDLKVTLRAGKDKASSLKPVLYDAVHHAYLPINGSGNSADKNNISFQISLPAGGSVFVLLKEAAAVKGSNTASVLTESSTRKELILKTLQAEWSVQFDTASGGLAKPVAFGRLTDWKDHSLEAIRHYSGMATYAQDFDWEDAQISSKEQKDTGVINAQIWLQLGRVDYIAGVTLNGIDCGVAWTDPYRVNITKALKKGKNHLEIKVANTWSNRIVTDHQLSADKRKTWTKAPFNLEGRDLLSGGLLGPVTIIMARSMPLPEPTLSKQSFSKKSIK